ncbi:MAG: 5-(carboxyamino)imidazole ribonucleotide synthase [Methylococcales bacterium]|nr:5-(carboxyamino)imidazole ribonucleotide synthase [Methylococcales bacterium]
MKIGILGGGQLARMLALAGVPLGLEFVTIDPAQDACAAPVSEHWQGAYDDPVLLERLGQVCDYVTYEFENIPVAIVEQLARTVPVYPSAQALAMSQDRLIEKQFLNELGIATAPFAAIDSLAQLEAEAGRLNFPAILKTRRFGYDGKGQFVIKKPDDLHAAWTAMAGHALILEGFVPFCREVSILAARSPSGDKVYYPLSENQHHKGILRMAKNTRDDLLQAKAERIIDKVLDALDYVGMIALEMFELEGELVANEFAPRVHNSGHWTLEGSVTSQFENHLRAVVGWPLGATDSVGFATMHNFIGRNPDLKTLLALPQVHVHYYGKSARKGRKVAHATVRADSEATQSGRSAAVAKLARQWDDS